MESGYVLRKAAMDKRGGVYGSRGKPEDGGFVLVIFRLLKP